MAKIAKNLTELIGGTPLMKLAGYSRKYGLQQDIVAKLESFNQWQHRSGPGNGSDYQGLSSDADHA